MSNYQKTIWNSGDIITDDKIANITNNMTFSFPVAYQLPTSIMSGWLIINKTFNEVKELVEQGVLCYILIDQSSNIEEMYLINPLQKIDNTHHQIRFQDDKIFSDNNNFLIAVQK